MSRAARWGALALVPALLALAGCSAHGTVTVQGDEARVDVALQYADDGAGGSHLCGGTPWWPGVEVTDVTVVDDTWSCRLVGVVHSGDPMFAHADGRYHVFVPNPYGPGDELPATDIDVTLRFPGPVLATTGETWGDNTARITTFPAHATVAADGPAPTPRLLAGGVGLLAGAGLGVAGAAALAPVVRRRRARPTDPGDEVEPEGTPEGARDATPASEPAPPDEDPRVWSPSGAPTDPPR